MSILTHQHSPQNKESLQTIATFSCLKFEAKKKKKERLVLFKGKKIHNSKKITLFGCSQVEVSCEIQ